MVLWFCIPSVLAPGMGNLESLFGPPRPVFAPLKTPSWPLDCVEEGFCTSFFLLLAHSNAYYIAACSKKMRIVSCFFKIGAAFQKKSFKYRPVRIAYRKTNVYKGRMRLQKHIYLPPPHAPSHSPPRFFDVFSSMEYIRFFLFLF